MSVEEKLMESLLIDSQSELADSESKREELAAELAEEKSETVVARSERDAAIKARDVAETALEKMRIELAKEKAKTDRLEAALGKAMDEKADSNKSETAALLMLTASKATNAQMGEEVKALRSKPPVVIPAPVAAKEKNGKTIRSVVRERDGNGKAVIVDSTWVN